jgi:hypothetical protein
MLKRTLCIAALVAVLVVAGCSSDKSPSAGKNTTAKTTTSIFGATTSTTVVVPAGFTSGDKAAFCSAFAEIRKLSAEALAHGGGVETVKADYSKMLEPAHRMQAAAPTQVKAAVDSAVKLTEKVAATGDLKLFEGDANQRNGAVIAQYASANCTTK